MRQFHTPIENPHWMLVDDNADVLAQMSAQMERLTGVEIDRFSSPMAALAAFADEPEKYEVVITDFKMPGMNGVELCRRLRALRPTQKIILTTGSGFFTGAAARRAGFCGQLNMPFPSSALRATLAGAGIELALHAHT